MSASGHGAHSGQAGLVQQSQGAPSEVADLDRRADPRTEHEAYLLKAS
jgi:hypothetical protein